MAAGIEGPRVDDLVLALSEVAANSVNHGGGVGLLRVWQEPGVLCCEVRDAGRPSASWGGHVTPTADQTRGRGLWMVNQLCDLVQIRSTPAANVVRVLTWV